MGLLRFSVGLFLASLVFCTTPIQDPTLRTDKEALLALFDSTSGDSWRQATGWSNSSSDPCVDSWYGVACSTQGRVIGLTLSNNHLIGTLPAKIANLTELQSLWLGSLDPTAVDRNFIFGTIPSEIGGMPMLQMLALDHNRIQGSIPSSLGSLSQLKHLDLSSNRLVSVLPQEFSNLKQLQTLRLNHNRFTGPINPLLNLTLLQVVDISNNNFTGRIPAMLGGLTQLRTISLSNNPNAILVADGMDEYATDISDVGTLSSDKDALLDLYLLGGSGWVTSSGWRQAQSDPCIGRWYGVTCNDIGRVISIVLTGNNLTNSIPRSIGQLTELVTLDLSSNQIRGPLPTEISKMSRLRVLNLKHNYFQGTLPTELGSLSELLTLDLSKNFFSGAIPGEIAALQRLRTLDLSRNSLQGSITAALGSLPTLTYLDLSINRLSGSIPSNLQSLNYLETLKLDYNMLTGTIPPELGNLAALKTFTLSQNKLQGIIPGNLGSMSGLEVLDASSNKLSGSIPQTLTQLPNLHTLQLSANNLQGSLPLSLGNLGATLRSIALAGNNLTGKVPFAFQNLSRIELIDLRNNRISGFVPNYFSNSKFIKKGDGLLLKGNQLSCPLPPWPSLINTDCASVGCPIGWVSDGKVCVPCRPGFYRHAGSSVCTRCPSPTVEVSTLSGLVSDKACGVWPTIGDINVLQCVPCLIATSNNLQILADETAADILTLTSAHQNYVPLTGYGTFTFNLSGNYPDNSIYTGRHYGGLPNGYGSLVSLFGRYTGKFVYGKRIGVGFVTLTNKDTFSGEYDDNGSYWDDVESGWEGQLNSVGIARYRTTSETYEGEWRAGRWHGRGALSFPSGNVYVGEFVGGAISGLGIMEYADGGMYTGQWSKGVRAGNGTMHFANGDIYEGSWYHDVIDGYGVMIYNDFTMYRGDWKDGLPLGDGQLVNEITGEVYVGKFVAGKRHGFGRIYYGNGDTFVGHFIDGLKQGDGAMLYTDIAAKDSGYQFLATFMFDVVRTRILPSVTSANGSSVDSMIIPTELRDPINTDDALWGDGQLGS